MCYLTQDSRQKINEDIEETSKYLAEK